MKKFTIMPFALILMLLISLSTAMAADDNFLTGDQRLACEAILCLSSPNRPSECDPALNRYFSIQKKYASDTRKARKNFLNQCPIAQADDEMVSLTSDISYAAGQCETKVLNKRGQWIRLTANLPAQDCKNSKTISTSTYSITYDLVGEYTHPQPYCLRTTLYWQVDTKAPAYCTELWNHSYTDFSQRPHIVRGQNPWDTKWAD